MSDAETPIIEPVAPAKKSLRTFFTLASVAVAGIATGLILHPYVSDFDSRMNDAKNSYSSAKILLEAKNCIAEYSKGHRNKDFEAQSGDVMCHTVISDSVLYPYGFVGPSPENTVWGFTDKHNDNVYIMASQHESYPNASVVEVSVNNKDISIGKNGEVTDWVGVHQSTGFDRSAGPYVQYTYSKKVKGEMGLSRTELKIAERAYALQQKVLAAN